jgi:hypothetical protein
MNTFRINLQESRKMGFCFPAAMASRKKKLIKSKRDKGDGGQPFRLGSMHRNFPYERRVQHRLQVNFSLCSNFDSLVGRTAHVKYLSDQKFIKMFTTVFEKFFV